MLVVLGIGSNLNRRRHIGAAMSELNARFGPLHCSGVYRTRAAGFDGPDFFNLVCCFQTDLALEDIQRILKEIESREGRNQHGSRFASRTLDMDVLMVDDLDLRDLGLDVPRGEILTESYVLKPLAELMPDVVHPLTGRTMADHWSNFEVSSDDQPLAVQWSPL